MHSTITLFAALSLFGALPAVASALPAHVTAADASASVDDFGPERLFDGNPARPWIAPLDAAGAPPTLTLTFDRPRWVSQVRLTPGHGGSNRTFDRHARPARIRVTWDGGARTFDLDDRRHRHALDLGHLVVTTRLGLTIEAVHGPSDIGLAISDLFVLDHRDPATANPQNYQRIQRYLLALSDDGAYERAQQHLARFGDKASPALTRIVAEADGPLRLRALEALVATRDGLASSVISHLLDGDPPEVMLALTVLTRRPLSGFADRLLDLIEAGEPTTRLAAFRALAKAGGLVAHQTILSALACDDAARRDAAVVALGELPTEQAIALADEALLHSDGAVRERGLIALGQVAQRSSAALDRLLATARTGPERERIAAIRALARHPADASRELLVDAMRRGEPRVARAATAAFITQDPDAERFFASSMNTLRPAVIEHAVELMRDRHSAAATQLLVQALASGVWEPWYGHAAELLRQRGETGVSAVVRWLIDHPRDERIVRHFLTDHASLAAPAAVAVLERVRRSRSHTDAKVLLCEVLRDSGYQRGAAITLAMYNETTTEASVRRAAFEALVTVGRGPEVEALILAALDSDDATLRRIAYAATGTHRITSALPRVQREITRTRPDEWSPGVVAAFGDLGGRNAIAVLKRHYPIAPQSTRLAILDTAWRSGSHEGIELLVDAMSSPDHETRRNARALLERHR